MPSLRSRSPRDEYDRIGEFVREPPLRALRFLPRLAS
jgi:hypothetical protein